MTELQYIQFKTNGKNDIIDITDQLKSIVVDSNISSGNMLVFVPGATGATQTAVLGKIIPAQC